MLYLHITFDVATYLYKFHVSDYNSFSTSIQFVFADLLYISQSVHSLFLFSSFISLKKNPNSLGCPFLIESCFMQRHSIHGMMEEENVIRPHQEIQALNFEEKKFLLAVERGDVAGTRR